MRMQADRQLMTVLRNLETPPEVRRAIESLLKNPYPEWAKMIPERENRYEFFETGFWVAYEVSIDRGETVITVLLIDKNQ
jgi:hypothetical protein